VLDEHRVRVFGIVEVRRFQQDVEALAVVQHRDFGVVAGDVEGDAATGPWRESPHDRRRKLKIASDESLIDCLFPGFVARRERCGRWELKRKS